MAQTKTALFKIAVFVWLILVPHQSLGEISYLAGTSSPYLAAHANDDIKWRPWSEAALKESKSLGKPIFLSIGYSACHWCHVMARTTFVDERVIASLNDNYIPILVDQEERPDIAAHYLFVMDMMTGQSGTPANFILSPDLVPIFSAGYLAPEPEFGQPGLAQLLKLFIKDWKSNKDAMMSHASDFYADISNEFSNIQAGKSDVDVKGLAALEWYGAFDKKYGGFGSQPKFPSANVLSFLLRHSVWKNDAKLLELVYLTLDQMAAGGLRDHLGGAFHRYSVDRYWQVPHFEIMLGENALMAMLYIDAIKSAKDIDRKNRYELVVKGILADLEERFWIEGQGFATSLDAENEDQEGDFYSWTSDEIVDALRSEGAEEFIRSYADLEYGMIDGRSILRIQGEAEELWQTTIRHSDSLKTLKSVRSKRVAPSRDNKILTSWNALSISAYAKAAQLFANPHYLDVALKTHAALNLDVDSLTHSRFNGLKSKEAFLDDYAYFGEALLDLYETTFDVKWLNEARKLTQAMMQKYQSSPGTLFQYNKLGSNSEIPLHFPLTEIAMPSGNAAALSLLLRIGLFDPMGDYQNNGYQIWDNLGTYLERNASTAAGILNASAYLPSQAYEIVIVGKAGDPESKALLDEAYKRLLPGTVMAITTENSIPNPDWALLDSRPKYDGKATAYLCQQRLCKLPVTNPVDFAKQLDALVNAVQ